MDTRKAKSANEGAPKHEAQSEESVLDAWRERVERAWSERGAGQVLDGERGAYADFLNILNTIFFYYGQNARAVERGTREG